MTISRVSSILELNKKIKQKNSNKMIIWVQLLRFLLLFMIFYKLGNLFNTYLIKLINEKMI